MATTRRTLDRATDRLDDEDETHDRIEELAETYDGFERLLELAMEHSIDDLIAAIEAYEEE